jgi:hypothetical protein
MRRVAAAALTALTMTCAVSCSHASAGGPQPVFSVGTPYGGYGPTHRDEVNDVVLPMLHNLTSHPVRILSVRLVNPPPGLHAINVLAYTYQETFGSGDNVGILPVECPKIFKPHAVSSFTTSPHSDSPWYLEFAFTLSKLGRYTIGKFKITYETNGHHGWQYQYIDDEFTVKNPPRPGPKADVPSAVCPTSSR